MSTNSANLLNKLFEEVSGDLIAHYDNSVLMPSAELISNSYNLVGAVGNKMRIPVTNAWTTGASGIAESADIAGETGAVQDFNPSAIDLSVAKRGSFSYVTAEALEDGGLSTVSNAVSLRLARSIAQGTDQSAFKYMLNNTDSAPGTMAELDGADSNVECVNNSLTGNLDLCPVFSPEAMAYAVKRQPELKMWEDVKLDQTSMVATMRNGFAQIQRDFIKCVAGNTAIGASAQKANLQAFGEAVAKLRGENAPTDAAGFYFAAISPAIELQLVDQITHIGSGTVGSLSSTGDRVLMDALIGQAVGVRFLRSNNIVKNVAAS
tara:strand:+ start:39 stop:1001 length:963 start_codon:yes stop_codon:yes gene_type:complete